MTRIGPSAAACTPCKARRWSDAMKRTRRGMCAVCNGNRPYCPRTGRPVTLHINGEPCPRGWHPDKRGRVRWAWVVSSGVPFLLRLWLYLCIDDRRELAEFVDSFAGCGCIRSLKAAWMRLARRLKG